MHSDIFFMCSSDTGQAILATIGLILIVVLSITAVVFAIDFIQTIYQTKEDVSLLKNRSSLKDTEKRKRK